MHKTDIRKIITKYLSQKATAEELSTLLNWIQKESNQEVFKKVVQAHFFINYRNTASDSKNALAQFIKHKKSTRDKKFIFIHSQNTQWLKYAALLLVLLTSSVFLYFNKTATPRFEYPINTNAISIQLENGEVIELNKDLDTIIKTKNGLTTVNITNGVLSLKNKSKNQLVSGFNTLSVPNGKVISVTLEDGSLVQLNSGSELKYPQSFLGASKRSVYLKGEAFFTIAPDLNKPFLVHSKGIYTQVYGTEFNISAYEKEPLVEVVLVAGSVGVGIVNDTISNQLKMIAPSQKLTGSTISNKAFTIENVNVTPYISWTKGIVVFENEPLSSIIKKLERRFNVNIVNENKKLSQQRFTGVFNKEDIELILKTIQTHTYFKYSKKGNLITILKEDQY